MFKSKQKGNRFERRVVKLLKSVFPDIEFERTPASGGSQLREGWAMVGDIVTTDPSFPFCIECKDQEGWKLEQLGSPKCKIYKWWEQACEQANLINKLPLLFFTRNRAPVFVAFVSSGARYIEKQKYFINCRDNSGFLSMTIAEFDEEFLKTFLSAWGKHK